MKDYYISVFKITSKLARYPEPLNEKEWESFISKIDKPIDMTSQKKIQDMIQRGSKIKVHM